MHPFEIYSSLCSWVWSMTPTLSSEVFNRKVVFFGGVTICKFSNFFAAVEWSPACLGWRLGERNLGGSRPKDSLNGRCTSLFLFPSFCFLSFKIWKATLSTVLMVFCRLLHQLPEWSVGVLNPQSSARRKHYMFSIGKNWLFPLSLQKQGLFESSP